MILSGISLLAPYWRNGRSLIDNPTQGLYYYCDQKDTHCQRYSGGIPAAVGSMDWLNVVQVFYPVAVFLALLSALCTWGYVIKRFHGAKAGMNLINFILGTGVLGGLTAALVNVAYMCEVYVSSVGYELDFCFYFNWVILPLMVLGGLLVRAAHADYEHKDETVGPYDMKAILNHGRGENLILMGSIMVSLALAMSVTALVSPFWQRPAPAVVGGSDIGLFYRVDPGNNYVALDMAPMNTWHIFCQVYYTLSAVLVLVSAAATVRYAYLRRDSSPVGQNLISTAIYTAVIAAFIDIAVIIVYKFQVFNYASGMELDFCWYFNLAIIPLLYLATWAIRQSFLEYESKSADAMAGMPALPYGQEYMIVLGVPMLAAGALMSIVSWFAPYWMVATGASDQRDGLYYYCTDAECGNLNKPSGGGDADWWRVAQVFYPFSSVFALIAAICLAMYIIKRNLCDQVNQTLAHGIFVATLLSAFFGLLATIGYSENVFMAGAGFKLGFAFYFNYAIIPLLVAGGVFIRESRCDFKPNSVAPLPGAIITVSEATDTVVEGFGAAVDAVVSAATAVPLAVAGGVGSAALALVDGVGTASGAVSDGVEGAGQGVVDGVASLTGAAVGVTHEAGHGIVDGAQALGGAVVDGAQAVGGAIVDGAHSAGHAVADFANNTGDAVVDVFTN